jgi:AcrR family transcriptional regulator
MRDRRLAISAAAIRLFDERGLDATTVDDIAEEAGVAPRTFFRHFATKEEAVFPDHDERIERLCAMLDERRGAINPLAAALEVARRSAEEYLGQPSLFRPRFQLVRATPALRDRERLIDFNYETAIADYLEAELDDELASPMRAKAMAAGIVAAVNYALQIWAEASEPEGREALHHGLEMLEQAFAPMIGAAFAVDPGRITITIPASLEAQEPLATVLRQAMGENGDPTKA